MKKNLLKLSYLVGIVVALVACNKETEEVKIAPKEVQVEDGILAFASQDAYEKLISSKTFFSQELTNLSFKSARIAKSDIPNEALASILSKDNTIQIGKWILKINAKASLVTVIDKKDKKSLYTDLLADKANPAIYRFSTDDDVLDLLEEGYKATPTDKTGARIQIFCGGGVKARDLSVRVDFPQNTGAYAEAYNTYEKYGIYFEASTRIDYHTQMVNSAPFPVVSVQGSASITSQYKTNCKRYDQGRPSYSGPISLSATQWFSGGATGGGVVYKFLVYKGTKGIDNIQIYSTYYYLGRTLTPPPLELD